MRLSNYLVLPLVKLLGIGLGFSSPGPKKSSTESCWKFNGDGVITPGFEPFPHDICGRGGSSKSGLKKTVSSEVN